MKLTDVNMLPIKCPVCGGPDFDKVEGELNWYKCQFCGRTSQFFNVDPSDRDVTPDTLLEKAYRELKSGDFSHAETDFRRVLDRAPDYASAWFGIMLAHQHCIDKADLSGDVMTGRYLAAIQHGETYTYCPTVDDMRDHIIRYLGDDLKRALETQNFIDKDSFDRALSAAAEKTLDKYTKQKYDYGVRLCSSGNPADLLTACRIFRELGGYLDSPERCRDCFLKTRELKYQQAVVHLKNARTLDNFQSLFGTFTELGNYKDSRAKARICERSISTAKAQKAFCTFFKVLSIIFLICSVLSALVFLSEDIYYFADNISKASFVLGLLTVVIPYAAAGTLAAFCLSLSHPEDGPGTAAALVLPAGILYSAVLAIVTMVKYDKFHFGWFILYVIIMSIVSLAAFVPFILASLIGSAVFRALFGKHIDFSGKKGNKKS